MQFNGDVVVVTGAGTGLGREHALLLGRLGARVVVNDAGVSLTGEPEDKAPAEQVVSEILAAGGQAVADTNSVATAEGGEAIIKTAVSAFGRVDAVVNNAGILRDRTFAKMTAEEFTAVLDVHLCGAFHVTRAAWGHMREQRHGRVVVTTSGAGLYGNFGQANYAAAKMGLVGLVKTLALEGAKYGIKANALSPAARTRMSEDTLDDELGPRLDPKLVSPVVAVLSHRDCPWTGETLAAGGGRVARAYVAETPGYVNPALDPDDLLAHAEDVFRPEGSLVPSGVPEQAEFILAQLRRHAG